MNFDHRNPRLRRGFAFVALAAVLGLAAVGLTQCRAVNDTVTGVDLSNTSGDLHAKMSCTKKCNDQYKSCIRAAEAKYKTAKKACHWNWFCLKNAQKTFVNDLKACELQKKLCKKSCYNEGSGSAGR